MNRKAGPSVKFTLKQFPLTVHLDLSLISLFHDPTHLCNLGLPKDSPEKVTKKIPQAGNKCWVTTGFPSLVAQQKHVF